MSQPYAPSERDLAIAGIVLSDASTNVQRVVDEFVQNVISEGEQLAVATTYASLMATKDDQNDANVIAEVVGHLGMLLFIARQQKTMPSVQYGFDNGDEVFWSTPGSNRGPIDNCYRHVTMGETIPLSKEDG